MAALNTRDREIRADFDRESLVVYQAYSDPIADAALAAGRSFVAPFSFKRMTWIKPSFLWLMARSQWGKKSGQTRILGVRILRQAWEQALAIGILTDPDPEVFPDRETWRRRFEDASVHVQWDPERSLRGAKLSHRSIQVGLGRAHVRAFAQEWITEIKDLSALTHKIHEHMRRGQHKQAKQLLPPERPYPLPDAIKKRLGMAVKKAKSGR